MGLYGLDWTGLVWGPVEGSCEHGNEPADSITFLGNSWVAAQLAASQEGLISMEFVNLYLIKTYISSHFPIITYLSVASIAHLVGRKCYTSLPETQKIEALITVQQYAYIHVCVGGEGRGTHN
jgi:hypothetical protein